MKTQNLGYPRIGKNRELKKANEKFWSGAISEQELLQTAKEIRRQNWQIQKEEGIDLIPSNDFSLYDQVIDMSFVVGAIPERYHQLKTKKGISELDLYFAVARGYQQNGIDVTAAEMTKWFDTNYHYIVPEFSKNQQFSLFSNKIMDEYAEALALGIKTKPVILGPVSFLLLGKEKEEGFHRLDLIQNLLPVYFEVLERLEKQGAEWIQLDEPFLALDLDDQAKTAYQYAFEEISRRFPNLKFIVTTYFDGLRDNLSLAVSLPAAALHIDLVRYPDQLEEVLKALPADKALSIGIIDGRNVWKNDYEASLKIIEKAVNHLGTDRILLAPSCSLLHTPCDLDTETGIQPEIRNWLAFSKQKIHELATLKQLVSNNQSDTVVNEKKANREAIQSRRTSRLIHNQKVKDRVDHISEADTRRQHPFDIRKEKQHQSLNLPPFPTTTIGSFPQTADIRKWRSDFKKGNITAEEYRELLKQEIKNTIRKQEAIGLDVLVHGESERNDMVEYFGELLDGFVFTKNGWVQSYGSRCVKPPVIFGDVFRPNPMTVEWITYAQSLTLKPVKGMLTGPVTILQWSFVRDDQPRSRTAHQIALAIRDEVKDLEAAGIKVIQIDEPAFREGLPLRKADWADYLQWAVRAFHIASAGVRDETQLHTHMCYSEFNDIIKDIASLDADVITIECSRSQMELLSAFSRFKYPNEIGPGVYDIHSPRIPAEAEIINLLHKAARVIPPEQLWVNPDCGLKTRHWEETQAALTELVDAAKKLRTEFPKPAVVLTR